VARRKKEPKVVETSDDIVTIATLELLRALTWRLKTTA
jgi:hypothetical protein